MPDTAGQRQGQCDQCGRTNSHNDLICYSCGALLPWATLPKAAAPQPAPPSTRVASKVSAAPQGFAPPRSAPASGGTGRQTGAGQPTAQQAMRAFYAAQRSDGSPAMTRRQFFGSAGGIGGGGLLAGLIVLRLLVRGIHEPTQPVERHIQSATEQQALHYLADNLDKHPRTPRFTIRWWAQKITITPQGPSDPNLAISYDRTTGVLSYHNRTTSLMTLHGVTDGALKAVAQRDGVVADLAQQGATVDAQPPSASPNSTIPPAPS